MMDLHIFKKFFKRFKAQGMVEFALVLPLLLVLIFGIIEAGRLLFLYSAVMSASREAVRYGSASGDVTGLTTYYEDCTGIQDAAMRIGRFAGVSAGEVSITYDHGPGTGSGPGPQLHEVPAAHAGRIRAHAGAPWVPGDQRQPVGTGRLP